MNADDRHALPLRFSCIAMLGVGAVTAKQRRYGYRPAFSRVSA